MHTMYMHIGRYGKFGFCALQIVYFAVSRNEDLKGKMFPPQSYYLKPKSYFGADLCLKTKLSS